jgi:hypothetical protein
MPNEPRTIVVNDRMQQGYTYRLTEPMGKHFDPEFKPELTPKQMLEIGVFGGKYMTDCTQRTGSERRSCATSDTTRNSISSA